MPSKAGRSIWSLYEVQACYTRLRNSASALTLY